jgi:hypothetical protein
MYLNLTFKIAIFNKIQELDIIRTKVIQVGVIKEHTVSIVNIVNMERDEVLLYKFYVIFIYY